MGRYDFSAQNVYKQASHLLSSKRIPAPPPWLLPIGTTPPSTRLVRPPMQRPQKPGKKASRLFKPIPLSYNEDQLRWEYFNDHPWELARPRVILENDGRDHERWDWSLPLDYGLKRPRIGVRDEFENDCVSWDEVMQKQSARPINGEAVVQRWQYLQTHTNLTAAAAYDIARKELYRYRHNKEVEVRVAREEAQAVGAYFGLGPLEVGEQLEDQAYENWKVWAIKETQALKALQGAAYTGVEEQSEPDSLGGEELQVEEIAGVVPGSKGGLTAKGGATVRP